jgi:o-succinylbenzoate---CoA ligase
MDSADLRDWVRSTQRTREAGNIIFLADPAWGANEYTRLAEAENLAAELHDRDGWLCIPTGGTSGTLRFARHDERTISAAVSGFQRHFGVETINAVGVLPLNHVSGLMALLRCRATGGRYVDASWKALSEGARPEIGLNGDWFISLVPTQLQRLLEQTGGANWLRRFRAVFVGGGPAWPALCDQADKLRVPVSLCYGMTETAAMVAAQLPEAFLQGARDVGKPMPHARIWLGDENGGSGDAPAPGGGGAANAVSGTVCIAAESVFRGYFPSLSSSREYVTEDIGQLDAGGALKIIGRRDNVIITGGKKVWPDEVESVLRSTGNFEDVLVTGAADPDWGQAVVACYPATQKSPKMADVQAALDVQLARYKHPKRYVALENWPRNAQGKVNRALARKQLGL